MALFPCLSGGSDELFGIIDVPAGSYLDLTKASSHVTNVVTIPDGTAVDLPAWQVGTIICHTAKAFASVELQTGGGNDKGAYGYGIKSDGTFVEISWTNGQTITTNISDCEWVVICIWNFGASSITFNS